MTLEDIIFLAFTGFNFLRLGSYLPQIVRVAKDQHGASAISVSTWMIWVGANGTTSIYALVTLGDPWIAVVHAVNTACCLVVVSLTIWKRLQFATCSSCDLVGASLERASLA